MPDYFSSARGAYKPLACQNLCIITLLLLWPGTGQQRGSAKILISQWKRGRKIKRSIIMLRTKQTVCGTNLRILATKKGKLLQCQTEVARY